MADQVIVAPGAPDPVTVHAATDQVVEVTVAAAPSVTVAVDPSPTSTIEVAAPEVVHIDVTPLGAPGLPGKDAVVGVSVLAAYPLNALTAVVVGDDGHAHPASSLEPDHATATVGVTTHAALAGEPVPVRTVGAVTTVVDLPLGDLYLDVDGSLTPDPDAGMFSLLIGRAVGPRTLVVRIGMPIVLATPPP